MIAIGVRTGSNEPERFEVERPEPREGEALVRTVRVGICGTDREILEGGEPRVPEGAEFLILGHEALGRVERPAGDLREGQLVVPSVRRALHGDHACRTDFLERGEYTERGIERRHGFAQEYWTERPEHLTPVPEALEPIAVLAEPFSVVEKAINETLALQRARLGDDCFAPDRTRALVVGPGAVGFAAAFACLARGFRVSIAGRDDDDSAKVALAKAIGVEYVNTERTDFGKLAESGAVYDLVIEAAGVGKLALEAAKAVAPRGAIALTGVALGGEEVPVDADRFLTETVIGNRLIVGSVNAAMRDFRDAVEHLGWADRRFPDRIRGMINSRYPVDRFAEAYAEVLDKKKNPDAIKTVIEFA